MALLDNPPFIVRRTYPNHPDNEFRCGFQNIQIHKRLDGLHRNHPHLVPPLLKNASLVSV